jgi:tol-pal system protein YbgF
LVKESSRALLYEVAERSDIWVVALVVNQSIVTCAARKRRTHSLAPIFIASLSFFITGCGAGIQQIREEMRRDLADVRSVQAQQAARLDEMREDVRRLTGQIEESQHLALGKTRELEQKLSTLGSRVPPPEGVPGELLAQDESRIAAITGVAADTFREGLKSVRTGDFSAAVATLDRFVAENPGTAFTDNALFWLGICYDKLGQTDKAVVSFSEVFQKYPGEDRVPAALFFLGTAFERLGQKEEATLTLQKLIEEHPQSSYAAQARSLVGSSGGRAAPASKRKR